MSAPPTPTSRPPTVTAAFWCWVVAAVLTAAQGLYLVSQRVPLFFLVAGGLLVVVGLAQGYLAGRARRGQKRFANAAVGLALATVLVLILMLLGGGVGVLTGAVTMVLLITGSAMNQRLTAQQWYDSRGAA